MGVPEMAVSKSIPMQTKVLFACDINPACQKMLHMNFPSVPVLKDVTQRVFTNGNMIARRDNDEVFRLPISTDMLDLYVSGFMCSSWSNMGKRNGFASKHAQTFFGVLASIKKLMP